MNKPALANYATETDEVVPSKRQFIKQMTSFSLLSVCAPSIAKAGLSSFNTHKALTLEHHHTGEFISLTYFEQGRYNNSALEEINYFLRDYHNGAIHTVDTSLLDQLYNLKLLLRTNKPFHIVSGYRSPQTNANLRSHSRGVAKKSLHMEGRAVDIRIEGISASSIRKAALSLFCGGVGYYPNSNFVHLDTGEIRTWRG